MLTMLHSEGLPTGSPGTVYTPQLAAAPQGMLQRLLAAEEPQAHRTTVMALLQANGFDAMTYGRLRALPTGGWSWSEGATYGDAPAAPDSVASFSEFDPRLELALRSCLPVFWSLEELLHNAAAAEKLQAERLRFVRRAIAAAGFQSGATLALAGPGTGERSVVHLLSQREHNGRGIDDALFGRVLVLGLGVHDYHSRQRAARRPMPTAGGELTAKQKEVLGCLAVGLADKQIADRLDMSLHTVDYHMRQLRKRFGARNRLQLTQLWESEM
jgi:DNA-binding CsgD family transcriptional regulator